MSRRSILAPAVLGLGFTACASPVEFDVMSCNVRYGTARDGKNSWPRRCELLAEVIERASPEVLGVQEALAFQLEFLAEHLPHHQRLGQGREGGDRGEHAALFIDRRVFEVLEHGDFWLSETPDVVGSTGWDAALPRICTWARLRARANGRELRVWNLHYDHRGATARRQSSALVVGRIAASPGPHLVIGDLNTGEHSPPLETLRAAGMRDTFRDLHPTTTAVGTFHGFRGGTGGEKIDYVMASDGIATRAAAILSRPAADGRWPSDHHLVTATLRY